MIASWPWGNYWEFPDDERFTPDPPCDPTVYPSDDEETTPALLGPDGEPIRYVERFPVGFRSAGRCPKETP